MSTPEPVKNSLDLAAICTAGTINVAQLNEWVTFIGGTLSVIWLCIRFYEWADNKHWFRKRRAS